MLEKRDLRIILLHEFKLNRNAAQATRNVVQVWARKVSERTVTCCLGKFRNGNLNAFKEFISTSRTAAFFRYGINNLVFC